MSRHPIRDGQPPWSFFIPITLAVVLGVLIADAIKLAIGTVFVTQLAAERRVQSTPASATAAPIQPQARTANPPAAAAARQPPPEAERPVELVQLPGPGTARDNGDERACINGTIALRVGNGWQQVVGTDSAPARCEAVSR